MQRKATAHWQGTAKEGKGTLSTQSATLDRTPYSFVARFGDGKGTNPEELIAAAHAGCFSMALAFQLNNAGYTVTAIDTSATLSLDQVPDGFAITAIHLETSAAIPGIDVAKFNEIAEGAKANCPVSKVLNARISMNAKLVTDAPTP